MSIQKEINRELLYYVFKNEDLPAKEELSRKLCKDDESKRKCFSNAYSLLESTEVIIDNKLNSKYEDIYEIDNIHLFVDILVPILPNYKKHIETFNEFLIKQKVIRKNYQTEEKYVKDVNWYKYEIADGKDVSELELTINDLYNCFITAKMEEKKDSLKIPSGSYNPKDMPEIFQSTLELSFRDALHHILNDNVPKISENAILEIVQMYYDSNEEVLKREEELKKRKKNRKKKKLSSTKEQRRMSAINTTKNLVIESLKNLELITEDEIEENQFKKSRYNSDKNRLFTIMEIDDSSWLMDARTKQDSIDVLIGGKSNMDNVSEYNKRLVRFIFNYMG